MSKKSATIDYVARAKKALALLDEESGNFAQNRAEGEAEGWCGEESLGGRFLLVLCDKDPDAKYFAVAYKTVGTIDELAREFKDLMGNEWWFYAAFDLEDQVRLEPADVTISFSESEKVDLE